MPLHSAGYKTAVKVLTLFVTKVKGTSSTRTIAGPTASKLVSDAVVAHEVRFDVLRDVAQKLGFELHKHAGSYRVKKDQTVLFFEAGEVTARVLARRRAANAKGFASLTLTHTVSAKRALRERCVVAKPTIAY